MLALLLHSTLGFTVALDDWTAKAGGVIGAGEGREQNTGKDWILMGTEKNSGIFSTKTVTRPTA